MALRLGPHSVVAPVPRVSVNPGVEGYFYPREVAEILGVPEIDYRQLRRLFKLGRLQAFTPVPETDQSWSRYTLRDVAAVREALRLAGGKSKLAPGRRLGVGAVEDAVMALMGDGIADPLLEVRMERQGGAVFALIEGTLINPVTGQAVLRDVFDTVRSHLSRHDGDVVARLREERDRKLRQVGRDIAAYRELA